MYLLDYIKIKDVAECASSLQFFGLTADPREDFIPLYLEEALFIY